MLVYYWIIIGNLGYNNKSDLSQFYKFIKHGHNLGQVTCRLGGGGVNGANRLHSKRYTVNTNYCSQIQGWNSQIAFKNNKQGRP